MAAKPSEVVREAVKEAGFLGPKHDAAAEKIGKLLDDLDARVSALEKQMGELSSIGVGA
jgi:hypothetical protein